MVGIKRAGNATEEECKCMNEPLFMWIYKNKEPPFDEIFICRFCNKIFNDFMDM